MAIASTGNNFASTSSRIEFSANRATVSDGKSLLRLEASAHTWAKNFPVTSVALPHVDFEPMSDAHDLVVHMVTRAIAEPPESRVMIDREPLAAPGALPHRDSATESGVVVTVTDNGPGVDARKIERAADEFYSTKLDVRRLGRTFVRQVVDAPGGTAVMGIVPGRGTTVQIWLPPLFADESPALKSSRS